MSGFFPVVLINVKCVRQQGLEMEALYLQRKCCVSVTG